MGPLLGCGEVRFLIPPPGCAMALALRSTVDRFNGAADDVMSEEDVQKLLKVLFNCGVTTLELLRSSFDPIDDKRSDEIDDVVAQDPSLPALVARELLLRLTAWAFSLDRNVFSSPLLTGALAVPKRPLSGIWVNAERSSLLSVAVSASSTSSSGISLSTSAPSSLQLALPGPPLKAAKILASVADSVSSANRSVVTAGTEASKSTSLSLHASMAKTSGKARACVKDFWFFLVLIPMSLSRHLDLRAIAIRGMSRWKFSFR